MPSQSFSGKSKEDLVVVARISGLLSDEQAQRMSRTALARFLEAAQAEADQARQRQPEEPAMDGTAAATAAGDTLVERPTRKPAAGRRRKASAQSDDQLEQIGLADETATSPAEQNKADAVAGLTESRVAANPEAKPAARTRRASAKSAPAAKAGPAAPEAAASEAAEPAARPARRTNARKAAPQPDQQPLPAHSPAPADTAEPAATAASSESVVTAESAATAASAAPAKSIPEAPVSQFDVKPASEPADLNALEPVEPTIAQAVAMAPQPQVATAPEYSAPTAPDATGVPATAGPDDSENQVSAPNADAAPNAGAGFPRPHKRPGRPPKSQSAAPAAAQAAAPAAAQPAATEAPARTPQRSGPVPVPVGRTPAPGQPTSHHERHARLPGGQGTHHSFIPAHHTLTTPAGAPVTARDSAEDSRSENRSDNRTDDRSDNRMDNRTENRTESRLDNRPDNRPQNRYATQADNAPARQESFQERQPGVPSTAQGASAPANAGQPFGYEAGRGQGQPQGQNQGQGAPFQQRGQLFNASGKMVRPAGDGYAEIGDQPGEGDGQAPAQPGQARMEGEPGKPRRPFVETGEMVSGVLEIMPDGYGFLRKDNYLQGSKDIYVPPQYIRRFNLREGDLVVGPGKVQRETDRYQALLYIKEVNGLPPERMIRRPNFDKLTPIYPNERFILETNRTELSTRIIDLVAPIGKGQRGMIVSPPKAGKTILLQKIANAISINNPDVKLIVLLIDERPEEVTDMQRSINGEVVYSTFDKTPENHVKVTELVLERAMRLVELNQDVVILLDSITRMGRAYNLTINPTGRTLSGGLDPGALYGPKRFFGAARNIEGGGSLTIIATALIDTGSRMDEVIFEEFKGTGNMEVYLDRKLSEKRIFPAIDINRSGTRREELLLTNKELDAVWSIRKAFSQLDTSAVTEMIINLLMKTNNNQHFVSSINVSLNDKNIFDAMRGNRPGQAQNGHSPG